MARVALLNLFSGLNISTAQLAAMLQSHGHECITVYLKHYFARTVNELGPNHRMSRFASTMVGPRGRMECWQVYEPFSEIEKDLLVGLLKDYRADLVGFSLTSSSIADAVDLTKFIKDRLSVPVIWGGVGPTVEPEEFVYHPNLLCVGEGEYALLDVVEAIDRGTQDFSKIRNIWGVENGTVFRNPPRPLVTDLDKLPFPTMDPEHNYYIDNNELVSNIFPPNLHNFYPVITTRGCPYNCTYCVNCIYRRMFDGYARLRTRSVSHVIEELANATSKYDLKRIAFYDDVFGTNKEWVDEFAARYKREIGLPFWCFVDPRFIRKEMLSTLNEAGMDAVEMGIQTGSQRVLKDIYNRNTPREQIVRATDTVVELGVECLIDLLTFVKGETEADCRETFDLLTDLDKEVCFVGIGKVTYYPNYDISLADDGAEQGSMTPALYDYYHRLYFLTRTSIPKWVVRVMGSFSLFRRFPRLLDPLLPKHYRVPKYFRDML